MRQEIVIQSKNRKSTVLVIIFSILTFQLIFVSILILFKSNEVPLTRTLGPLGLYGVLLYFVIKGLIWELKGMRQLRLSESKLTFDKRSPLTNKSKTYDLDKIKAFDVKDTTVKEGPLAMLQLLGIADKVFLTFEHDGRTIRTFSGNSIDEMRDIKNKIETELR
ncbi:hypothetical protein ACFQ21_18875 [Ohtaekwangia kribbensis]|jgi:hypothetical protein|uniref:PH domain-containing protein n=1 Tax=Ohtaekwangia kribbensis TaxID=688913 RepID=A0ABW3K5H4_9BACT